ncbi:MAG: response regulator [Actinomycetia bacterium]|nr:response regulator [Actinomycetes bacterium]
MIAPTTLGDHGVQAPVEGEALRILMVEDNPVDVLHLRKLIEDSPLKAEAPITAPTLREGLAHLADGLFDVVLVDLNLPDTTAVDGVDAIVSAAAGRPVIVLTGLDDEEMAVRCVEHGAQDYVVKSALTSIGICRAVRHAVARSGVELRLRNTAEALRRSNSELETFSAAVAHDLRAPLRTARLFVDQLIRRIVQPDEVAADMANRAEESLARLDASISALLELASLRDGIAVEMTPASLSDVADTVVERLQADLSLAGATVNRRPLPRVAGNQEHLVQLLQNLMENSIKYRRAEVPLRISVDARTDNDRVLLSVADNGVGIPPEHRERVFEVFQRLHGRGEVEGLGVGLATCERIARLHGGSISLSDGPGGQGTTVTVELGRGAEA